MSISAAVWRASPRLPRNGPLPPRCCELTPRCPQRVLGAERLGSVIDRAADRAQGGRDVPQIETSLYRILQVDPAAEDVVIHAAYRALMKRHHPDRGGSTVTAEQLNRAYATLRDPDRRQAYDRSFPEAGSEPASVGPSSSPLVVELGSEFRLRFEPVSAPGFAWMFDFVGAV